MKNLSKVVLSLLLMMSGVGLFAQNPAELTDEAVLNKLEAYYHLYEIADTKESKALQQESIQNFYRALPDEQRGRINNQLAEKVFQANDQANDAVLEHETNKYLLIVPEEEDGRNVFYGILAGIYENRLDADALQELAEDVKRYEVLKDQSFPEATSRIAAAQVSVTNALNFDDELDGLWISETHSRRGVPDVMLDIFHNVEDSLMVHYLPGSDYDEYDEFSPADFYARQLILQPVDRAFSFRFGAERLFAGNEMLARGVGNLGAELAQTIKSSTSGLSFGASLGGGLIGTLVGLGATLGAAAISRASLRRNMMDISGIMKSAYSFDTKIQVVQLQFDDSGNLAKQEVENELSARMLKITPEMNIHFIDGDKRLIGVETLQWTDDEQEIWWKQFKRSAEFKQMSAPFRKWQALKWGLFSLGVAATAGGIAGAIITSNREKPGLPLFASISASYIGVAGIVVPLVLIKTKKKVRAAYNEMNYQKLYDTYELEK